MANTQDKFKQVIAHAKEYGYIFGSSEIYDGLSAVYDYGQNGVLLKNNKILLSPHSATFTDECTSRMAIETVKNVIDFFEDKIQKEMIVKL